MFLKKFWQKFSQNTALATPSPSLFNCVCYDVTPSPLPKAFYPPPNGQVLLHVWPAPLNYNIGIYLDTANE